MCAAISSPAKSLGTVSDARRPAVNVCEMRGSTLTKRTRDRLGFQCQTNPILNTVATERTAAPSRPNLCISV